MTKIVGRRTLRWSSFQLLIVALCAACSAGSKGAPPGSVAGSSGTSVFPQGGTGGKIGAPTAGSTATGIAGAHSPTASGSGGAPIAAGTGGGTAGGTSAAAGHSGAGTSGAAGDMSSAGAGGSTPTVACNPADKTADPTKVEFALPSEGPGLATPTGKFKPVMESDPGIPTHTIIRPDPLGGEFLHPILAWGEGGCGKSGNIGMFSALFQEFASHGVLIVADGPPGNGPTMAATDATPLLFAIEWAQKENERPCSQYYHKLDVNKVAVSGQSCGGLMAIQAAVDPKITTAFPYDSGLFSRDQTIYDALHAPMAIFDGGDQDIAYANGLADFQAITKIPMLFANPTSCSSNAHVCTFFDSNAGEFGRAGVAWINWQLLDDQGPTGKGMFIGDNCGLCDSKWNLMWKMKPM
jgi:hypothetical protein